MQFTNLLNINKYTTIMKIFDDQLALFVLSLLLLSSMTLQREIQLPNILDKNPISVKLGLTRTIKQPQYDFDKVYSREVHQIRSAGTYSFPPCRQNRPEIQFDVVDQIVFEGIPKKPLIITDFEDIKYSQFLLDIYYDSESSNLYIMFKNGRVAVIAFSNEQITEKNVFDVQGLTYQQDYLEAGYFVKVSNDLLFVNNKKAIKVEAKSAVVLKGFLPHEQFQSVHAFESGTFGILETMKGITIYKYDGTTVQKVYEIGPHQLYSSLTVTPQMKDLVYWPEQKTILLLDKFEGVRSYKLSIEQNNVSVNQNSTGDASPKIVITESEPVSRVAGCKLMYLYTQTLYLYCDVLYAYDLQQWPRVNERRLPYPNIEVQQIYEVDNLIALVGKNVFSVLYLERMVNYYQDGNLDKLVFYKDMFISANEEGVDIGRVKIIKPYITCNTEDDKYIGTTELQFKTKAQCNPRFFTDYNISTQNLGTIKQEDVCIYTVMKPISYWKEGQIKTFPFYIAILIILGIGIVAVVVFLVKRQKIKRVMQMINEYSTINSQSESAKPQQLNEEMDENVESGENKKEDDKQEGKKPSQIELANNMHDIA